MNFFQNNDEIKKIAEQYCSGAEHNAILALSFRYSQVIDDESLEELTYLVEGLRNVGTNVIFTGLHPSIINKFKDVKYFSDWLQQSPNSMYSLHIGWKIIYQIENKIC